jgi:galactokinase
VVARAPGRLDVMGGIADYSGSLVLQLPLVEACHVAAQLRATPPGGPVTLRSRMVTLTCIDRFERG